MAFLWQFKIVDEVKRSNDENHLKQLLASKTGWRRFGPESSARCEQALQECSPMVRHYLTLSPMVAYKVALGYATDNGLMYYRTALPNSSARLIAKPCAPPLALTLEVSPATLVCPLFDLPGVRNQLMFLDWMHVMDEGFGALVAGQILHDLLPLYPGNSAAKRVGKMWERIQCLYQADKTEACRRLTKLTLKDIVKRKKPAELDVKAAHCCQSPLKQNSAMWGQ